MTTFTHTIGIDGCSSGWVWVQVGETGRLSYGVAPNMRELVGNFKVLSLALLDMPIGFVEGGEERRCDVLARQALRWRSSSVFPVPCRAAVYAKDYETASALNHKNTGRRLSKQSWAITPKMREVDQLLQSAPEWRSVLCESHPELMFMQLNDGQPLLYGKKEPFGFLDRLTLLGRWLPDIEVFTRQALVETKRSAFAADDLLDAAVLALSAVQFSDQLISLPADPPLDATGLPMQIVSLDS